MYNLNDFVCCIPQIKGGLRASYHQSTKFPTNINRQTQLYETFASMCNWFQNKSPTHTFAVDWDTRHGNWAAPCYFNGASPTGSARWGYCLQRHLACEGLYQLIGREDPSMISAMIGGGVVKILSKSIKFSRKYIYWPGAGVTNAKKLLPKSF